MITDTRSKNVVAKGDPVQLSDIDLCNPDNFVPGVPHEWFDYLRREAPVQWHPDPDGASDGFWSVTRFDDCVGVNRDYEHFSSSRAATLFSDFDEEVLEQQRLMMLNMDPPMHTRYRRLVNKGFTPRMIRDLEQKVISSTDAILDAVSPSMGVTARQGASFGIGANLVGFPRGL